MAEHAARALPSTTGRRRGGPVRSPAGPCLPVHHRDVGALLLLRDARAARSLYDEASARARAGRERARPRGRQERARSSIRSARPAALVFADLRALHGARLSDADFRRSPRRSRPGPAPHRNTRRNPHGDRPFHDGDRAAVPVCTRRADPRQRRLQAEHLHPGRRALRARRSAARPRLLHLLCRHQYRRVPGAAGLRHARRTCSAGTTVLPPPASAC